MTQISGEMLIIPGCLLDQMFSGEQLPRIR